MMNKKEHFPGAGRRGVCAIKDNVLFKTPFFVPIDVWNFDKDTFLLGKKAKG
jgi:hypothetical protein